MKLNIRQQNETLTQARELAEATRSRFQNGVSFLSKQKVCAQYSTAPLDDEGKQLIERLTSNIAAQKQFMLENPVETAELNTNCSLPSRLDMLEDEERLYESEIRQLEDELQNPLLIDGVDESLAVESSIAFDSEMQRTSMETEEMIRVVSETNKETQAQIARTQKTLDERVELVTSLTAESEKVKQQPSMTNIALLRDRRKVLKTQHTVLVQELIRFLDLYFPHDKSASAVMGLREIPTKLTKTEKHISLKDIVLELINLSVHVPSSPFLRVDDTVHWTPYIELLLRSIAEAHENDSRLIRLIDFAA